MKNIITSVLFMLLFVSTQIVNAMHSGFVDSTEYRKIKFSLTLLKSLGEEGKLDSLEILSNQLLDELEGSEYQDEVEIKAEIHNILANYGRFTEGNTYRIENRKKALLLFRKIDSKDKYIYSTLFLSKDFFEIKQIDSALYYLDKAEEFLSNDTLSLNLARCFTMRGNVKNQTGNSQGAIVDHLRALQIIKKQEVSEQTSFQLSVITSNISGCYIDLEDYNNSLKYALIALDYSEAENFPVAQKASTLTNLAVSYFRMGLVDKARPIYEDILERKESISNVNILISAYNNLASITDSIPEAMKYINEAELLCDRYKANYYRAEIYNVKSILLTNAKQYVQAEHYAHLAIKENLKTDNIIGVIKNQSQLVNIQYLSENYNKVLELGREFLPKAKTNGSWYDAAFICETMIDAAVNFDDVALLYSMYREEKEIRDTIDIINNKKIFSELNTKYQTEKKEQQIELLEIKTQNQKLSIEKTAQERNMTVAGIVILVLLILPLGFYARQRNKNKVLEARINSENKECTRISKELHDGVSGSLTTIRYLLESGAQSDQLVKNIESLSKEVRGVSHKLNMSALANQGIKEAIFDALMLDQFPKDIDLQINLPEGFEIKEYGLKINIIRILQELVQNTIKYAEANKISIDFEKQKQELKLSYSDNGNGCDLTKVEQGNGLRNIEDRVLYIKGSLKLDSQLGNGFFCKIII